VLGTPAIAQSRPKLRIGCWPIACKRYGCGPGINTITLAKAVLGDAQTPWHGGAASLRAESIQEFGAAVPRYLEACYAKGVDSVRKAGVEANRYLKGCTAVEGDLIPEVPLSGYRMFNGMTAADVTAMQKRFDPFAEKKVFEKRLMVEPLPMKA
jgi:NitT/TauT family transport system substrate-binding protein